MDNDTVDYVKVNENFKAYRVFNHQHQPEIQQYLSELSNYSKDDIGEVIFTPHLLPIDRGILSTIYLHFSTPIPPSEIEKRFSSFANKQNFVLFLGDNRLPDIKMTQKSNKIVIGAISDYTNQNWVIITSLDNLRKGASGQAIQNMNLMFGLEENLGLY